MTTPRSAHPTPRCSLAILLVLLALPARAHEFWLTPSRYVATPGHPIEVGAVAGTGFHGERQPWSPAHGVRLLARTARTFDLMRAASPGDLAWTRFAPSDSGGALLAFESSFTLIELPAPAFDAYLALEGLREPLAARQLAHVTSPGRERFRRCAKAWLTGDDATRALAPVGLALELVPLSLPGAAATLRVRVQWAGKPLAGARVKAWRAPLSSVGEPADVMQRDSCAVAWQAVSDARGEVLVPCAAAGEWMLSVVHMVRCPEPVVADWESTWASLTFARVAAPDAGPDALTVERRRGRIARGTGTAGAR